MAKRALPQEVTALTWLRERYRQPCQVQHGLEVRPGLVHLNGDTCGSTDFEGWSKAQVNRVVQHYRLR